MPHEDEQLDRLPPAIIEALRDLDGPAVLPDAQRDADVLSGARQHLAGIAQVERKRRDLRLFFAGGAGGAVAAAAMVALVAWLGNPFASSEPHADQPMLAMSEEPASPQPTTLQPGDLDASGNVDILDAYLLARQVEQGGDTDAYDFNSDGRIDQHDIDLLASRAVALSPGEQG
ncbi:MAG: dockerin type I domain-containing protein [Planctomycetota bacterium]